MGKVLLVGRLVARDLRHRPGQAVLLLLAITAATATLTLGLALHGVTSQPYAQTRVATNGPDVVAYLPVEHVPGREGQLPADATTLIGTPGVTGHSGPYPLVGALVRAGKLTAGAEAEGREESPVAVDQPKLTAGTWVRPGGVVLERTFAEALGVGVGDRVTLNGRPFRVAGTAVTAANPPYLNLCYIGGGGCAAAPQDGNIPATDVGLLWLTEPAADSLATSANPVASYVLNLKLKNPASAQAFANGPDNSANPGIHPGIGPVSLASWQGIAAADGLLVQDEQQVLMPGAWLAGLLALATVAVLAGGRMAERTRRVGLLKAVGGTPRLVAGALLAENMILALAAAAAGLAIGWLAAPLITSPGAAMVGTPGAPSLTLPTVGEVVAVALVVALAATLVTVPPAWWLAAAVLGTLVAVAGLTTIPARIGARRPAAEILQSETA
jgi:putative ABC transport system permease protein